MSKVLALVPARGGSKGVKRKNLRHLGGKPLLNWTLEVALNCSTIDRVLLSTDDIEIAEAGLSAGADVPFLRPDELAGDHTPDFAVFEHAMEWLERNESSNPDIVVWLRPTSPLRVSEDIEKAVQILQVNKCHAVRSVCLVEHHPYWMKELDNGKLSALISGMDENHFPQRQTLPPVYRLNGAVDVISRRAAFQHKALFAGDICGYQMPADRSVDLDTEMDFEIAEFLLRKKSS